LLKVKEEDDIEDFLSKIHQSLLLFCECFHTDIDVIEKQKGSINTHDSLEEAHIAIENMYRNVVNSIDHFKGTLLYSTRLWETEISTIKSQDEK
jgi:hypothetical protein